LCEACLPPERNELCSCAGELALALATCVDDLREHIRLAQDQNVVRVDPDLRAPVLGEDDLVALLQVHLDALALLLAAGAGADLRRRRRGRRRAGSRSPGPTPRGRSRDSSSA